MGKDPFKDVREGKAELDIFYLANRGIVQSFSKIPNHWYTFKNGKGMRPPLQPIMVMLEGEFPAAPFIESWFDTFEGSGGLYLAAIKLFERIAYARGSQLHGMTLQKINYQRQQAKELLATIQNLKTAIINIENDLEKMGEQIRAFLSNDWEQIKGIFVDNYGGPDRSWTAIARNVPLVRLAMTWFFRLKIPEEVPLKQFMALKVRSSKDKEKLEKLKEKIKEKCEENKKKMIKEVDRLIKEEQMNPALGNYLKRKLEEFWNWIPNYVSWLKSTYDRIKENLAQQKANLKMYMKWAADAIRQATALEMDISEFEHIFPERVYEYEPMGFVRMDYIFAAVDERRPDLWERTYPWHPVILTSILLAKTTQEVQKPYTYLTFYNMYGYIHAKDLQTIKELASGDGFDLVKQMIKAGAFTEEEIKTIFTKEEIEMLQGKKSGKKKEELPIFGSKWWKEKVLGNLENLTDALNNFLGVFGLSIPKQSLPWARKMRAAAYAARLLLEGVRMYKKSNGMLVIE